jgi:hypothetical protein
MVARTKTPPKSTKPKTSDRENYGGHRDKMAEKSRERSERDREIGPLPKVPKPKQRRKDKCRKSLRLYCEIYLADRFDLAWSDDQLKVIARLETLVLRGGLFALAMPRGSGKTTLCEAAALWAVLYGHRRFVVLVGASQPAAEEILESIKLAIETNDLLLEDFPEVVYPIVRLEGNNGRAKGQTLDGVRTRIEWTDKRVKLPTVKGSPASGSVLACAGITGRVRGMKSSTVQGKVLRPDMCLVDDPQDDDSAESETQTGKRERIIKGALKGLAGPGKTIAMAIPCTVIAPEDLSSRILDRKRNPQFRGERMKMVYVLPKRMDLWERYADLRNESFRNGGEGEEATEFYREHRAGMDEGAVIGWPARFDPDNEISGIQAAMNLRFDNPISFAAECQNEPLVEATVGMRELKVDQLLTRWSGVPRGQVPRECTKLTAFIDCHKHLLWYAVAAWDPRFGGSIIDFGTWPGQTRPHFRHEDPRPTLAGVYPGILSDDARLYAGLKDLTNALITTEYGRHESGEPHRINLCLIDRGYKPDVVHKLCRASPHAGLLRPSIGHSVAGTGRNVRQWPEISGEERGHKDSPAWRWGYSKGEHAIGRRVVFDADEWKGFAADRLLTPAGGYASVSLPGSKDKMHLQHRLLCEHLAGEFGAPARINGYEFEKWTKKPNRDVHLWDCFVGCCVAASNAGLRWSAAAAAGEPEQGAPQSSGSGRKFSDIQREKLARH